MLKVIGIVLALGAAVFGVGVGFSYLNAVSTVATAPARVISRTMETGNIIYNYEYFHRANGSFETNVATIRRQKGFLANETDPTERNRLRMELGGQQTICQGLANEYNARSRMTNRGIFRGTETPEELNPVACE